MAVCPAGHDSSTSDYCDTCGARMDGPAVPVAAALAAPAAGSCPVCQGPRTGRFCEECGHDFSTGTGGTTFTTPTPPSPVPVPPPPPPAPSAWVAVVAADRAYFDLMTADDPDTSSVTFPPYCPERRLPLTGTQIRIGRRSVSSGVTPEIDLAEPPADPGISHLHAVLLANPDGTWQLVDPGSTNGTIVNTAKTPIEVNVAVPINEGDQIHVGAWTTITLRRA
jgi:FHA domain